ncbi:MAG: hypothetical protein M1831_004690 [Alyxoria varia]|nr:MAG: hypothetical protein M1831_004690 [Alyxoria varia]
MLGTVCLVSILLLILPIASPFPADWKSSGAAQAPIGDQPPRRASEGLSLKELQDILKSTPAEDRLRASSEYYTSGAHLAGKNQSQAEWTRDQWRASGVEANLVDYDVYINYPQSHRLALLKTSDDQDTTVEYEAKLKENVLEEDPTSGLKEQIPTFHGYSANGNVTAQYLFVNYGTYQDFEDLRAANVSLEGKIAIAKYGGVFRGLIMKRAEELGMIGAILYTDPGDDGPKEKDGVAPYPEGYAREPSSVQRGSAQYLSVAPGDPTTPGYPSKPGVPRKSTEGVIPRIPSLPISYEDAVPLLKALNGHGPKASSFNKYWQQGGLDYKGVEYNIGPSPAGVEVNLVNDQSYVTTPIWNVIGIINGTRSDEVVVLGNHRDAWIAGGASDPNSGSAALNELVRGLGIALEKGWKPHRSIVLASWDGEEYGLLGSTEWVEEYIPWLSDAAVAYLNVDVAVMGKRFMASAAPLLNKVLIESAHEVQSPNQTVPEQTVGDLWDTPIRTMGSGSDFTAFQDYAGIPCVDMGFSNGPEDPVYMYHSIYDSFAWMQKFGDPDYRYHAAIASVWGVLAAKLVESLIIPFSAVDYGSAMEGYINSVKTKADEGKLDKDDFNFSILDDAIKTFQGAASRIDQEALEAVKKLEGHPLASTGRNHLFKIDEINKKLKYLERQFLYDKGLDNRSWFRHITFAPGLWTGYAGATFPGLVESVDARDAQNFGKWRSIVADKINLASGSLD